MKKIIQISQINIYPIKSTANISLKVSPILEKGLRYDRKWIVVNKKGKALTAREHPSLVHIRTEFHDSQLLITAPQMTSIKIPLESKETNTTSFSLFGKYDLEGVAVTQELNGWISEYLNVDAEILYSSKNIIREMAEKNGSQKANLVEFVDSSPIHLITESSLEDLVSKSKKNLNAENFRPNLVISGTKPYIEDQWNRIQIGECIFDVNKLCSRCVFTTLDQEKLTFDKKQEPLRTLSKYKKNAKNGVDFGIYLIPRSTGNIHIGDTLSVIS